MLKIFAALGNWLNNIHSENNLNLNIFSPDGALEIAIPYPNDMFAKWAHVIRIIIVKMLPNFGL